MKTIPVLALAFAVVGCFHYAYSPTTQERAASKPAGCSFDVYTSRPDRSYVELGVIDIGSGRIGDAPRTVPAFKEQAGPLVCGAGGDAVLTEINGFGAYVRGTVIKFR